jgi:hypothetical protein
MVEAGLTLPFALNKLFSKMDAKKQIMMGKVGISVDDNDAQLRATEQVLKLHERSGRIPSNKEQNGGANIIVIIE